MCGDKTLALLDFSIPKTFGLWYHSIGNSSFFKLLTQLQEKKIKTK